MKRILKTKEITLIAILTALTAVLAQISFPLPFTPIPISFGLVAVYMSAILLKPKHAVICQICYLLLGAIGLPVYSNFKGGLGALFGPTGGYLMAYPIMALIVSLALNSEFSLKNERIQRRLPLFIMASVSICIAHLVLYFGGTIWLSKTTGSSFIGCLKVAVYPYIPLDIAKIVFCVLVVVPLRSRLKSLKLLQLELAKN